MVRLRIIKNIIFIKLVKMEKLMDSLLLFLMLAIIRLSILQH